MTENELLRQRVASQDRTIRALQPVGQHDEDCPVYPADASIDKTD